MRTGRLARHETDLGFKPRHAVRWLSPPQLARTGLRVLIAQVLTSFSDSRETQAVSPQTTLDVDRFKHVDGHLWIDFVADLGDGFDATFTIASLLSQPELMVSSAGSGMVTLPKSQLVLMGGDQVYPTASSQGYEDRMQGPYRAASGETPNAALLALPGNHDWYDGLTAFMRMFAQGLPSAAGRRCKRAATSRSSCRPAGGWWVWTASWESILTSPNWTTSTRPSPPSCSPGTPSSCVLHPPRGKPRPTIPMLSTTWSSSKTGTCATGTTR